MDIEGPLYRLAWVVCLFFFKNINTAGVLQIFKDNL